jgi:hypothetical protein
MPNAMYNMASMIEPKKKNWVDLLLVERLWKLYAWPESTLPMRGMTPEKIRRYPVQAEYVSDDERTWTQPPRRWDYGRIRYFYDLLNAGGSVDPIDVDNVCEGSCVYPELALLDGHHRLAGAYLAKVKTIPAHYGGRSDLLKYLTGKSRRCPE